MHFGHPRVDRIGEAGGRFQCIGQEMLIKSSLANFCHQQKYRQSPNFNCQTINFLINEDLLNVVSSPEKARKATDNVCVNLNLFTALYCFFPLIFTRHFGGFCCGKKQIDVR